MPGLFFIVPGFFDWKEALRGYLKRKGHIKSRES